ncbi:MAG: hypothetical protein KDD41_00655 [Flavobacteriales bacterium]|nr:hypothetical protein [Flavobacteriales bacterium]
MTTPATIIALAWPDTPVIREGKWYDLPMSWLGFLKDGYYKAGHAAFLLINHHTGDVHYFDYGRYHTPYQCGRVRDQHTDPDVAVPRKALIVNGEIANLEELLLERYGNPACHGEGRLTAAITRNICFDRAYAKAKQMQAREAIPYGPFVPKGSTCSRLVVQVVHASTKDRLTKLLIRLPYTISATPRSNNKVLNDHPFYYEVEQGRVQQKRNTWYGFKQLFQPRSMRNTSSMNPVVKTV